jgi:hypothetical protein
MDHGSVKNIPVSKRTTLALIKLLFSILTMTLLLASCNLFPTFDIPEVEWEMVSATSQDGDDRISVTFDDKGVGFGIMYQDLDRQQEILFSDLITVPGKTISAWGGG